MRYSAIPALALLLAAAACSDTAPTQSNAGTPDSTGRAASLARDASSTEVFEVNLSPLNARAQQAEDPDRSDGALGVLRGKAHFYIQATSFEAVVDALGAEPDVVHPQHVHAGARCPTAADDANSDGYVDVIEGLPDYGPILIPLDSDLDHQAGGTFPTAFGRRGALNYQATADFATMLADLNAPDPDPTDAVVKLNGAPLALETRHVVIHGVDLATPLPSSVATLPGVPAQLTLPVACGEIRRVR